MTDRTLLTMPERCLRQPGAKPEEFHRSSCFVLHDTSTTDHRY